ncbi:hypothetical protein QO058_14895 [Bosea vestrisii]|uniref:hypothetical protein n=1 Tax=Bosea vestrisii TaxID=151416 RepID=UPI0024E02AA9|nr:hypothetical protein [Bosea vestrisii]WID94169.1 hypothetical protein QO058_14895 [Bosea vestrisii]
MLILVLSGMAGLLGSAHATGKRCQMNAIERSKCIIEAILADISRTYKQVGGGGISAIKQNSTTSFTVSISQEERIDLLTYEAMVDGKGKVSVKKTGEGTRSP